MTDIRTVSLGGHFVRAVFDAKFEKALSGKSSRILRNSLSINELFGRTHCPENRDTLSAEPKRTLLGLFRDPVSGLKK
jgi:hypothetical protein